MKRAKSPDARTGVEERFAEHLLELARRSAEPFCAAVRV